MKLALFLLASVAILTPFAAPSPTNEMCINAHTGEVQVHKMSHEFGQEQPKPKEACFPVKKDKTPGCQCLKQDEGKGCKDGQRDVEMSNCSAYCHKDMCACCRS